MIFIRAAFFFLILCSLSPTLSFSQILNIEKFRLDKDTSDLWLGNASLGFAAKKQQNNIYTANTSANVVYLSKNVSYMSLNKLNLIRQNSVNLINTGYSHERITFRRQKKLCYEPFIQYQFDAGRGLINRELVGFAPRYTFFSGENNRVFAINSGIMFEHELWKGQVLRFQRPGFENLSETYFIKSTTNVTYRANIVKNVNLFLVGYYQARFGRFFRPRVILDITLQFTINKYLKLKTQLNAMYDALPMITKNSFVYTLNNSLVVNFNP